MQMQICIFCLYFEMSGLQVLVYLHAVKKRLHRNIVIAITEALKEIFEQGRYADRVLEKVLKSNPLWGVRDRRQIAETVYDMVRWWRRIRHAAAIKDSDDLSYLLAVRAWYTIQDVYEIPDWLPELGIKDEQLKKNYYSPSLKRAVKESIPDWLDEMGSAALAAQWQEELSALNQAAPLIIRVNSLKTNKDKLAGQLSKIHIETQVLADFPDALMVNGRPNLFQTEFFKQGAFEIQDASSQMIAYFAGVKPGMRVIDACAGGGGKSLHIAALMQNKGTIIAMDVEQWKLDELKKRAKRAGVFIIEPRLIENNKAIKRLRESADIVLLDVPCSGLGVLKRNPDAKWKLDKKFMNEVNLSQEKILKDYSQMLKPGGKLVYVTCSIMPAENFEQVAKFLDSSTEFLLEEHKTVLPSEGFDGFYMARLIRKAKIDN